MCGRVAVDLWLLVRCKLVYIPFSRNSFSGLCSSIKDTQVVSLRIVLDHRQMCLVRDMHTRSQLQICLEMKQEL